MGVWENVCIGASACENGALGMQETKNFHFTLSHTHTHSLSTHLVLEDDPGFVLV